MKKIISLFFLLITVSFFGQTESEIIKEANDLIANKKYESAFNLLSKFDPKNDNPNIVLLKEDILLNYFVTSIMHQLFALKDLETNEDIMDYRGGEGSYNMRMFPVDSVLNRLIKIYPDNCKLYKGLGDFYYDAYLRYGGKWLKDDEQLFTLMQNNFKKTISGNCADYMSHYVLGYTNVIHKKYKESIPYFLSSIEMNSNYATSYYNLAYAYLFTDDRENALTYAKNALDLYNDKAYKSDAARMIGQIYSELDNENSALSYYGMADKIDPNNYYNLKPILYLCVKTNNQRANETRRRFFNLAPQNPTIYDDLEEVYSLNNKESDLIAFYKSQFTIFKDNENVLGNLNFYLGRIYIGIDKKVAKEYFTNAKAIFKKVFEKDHAVFKAIDVGLEQCKE